MKTLPARQVHLDFHNSELISGIGQKFDKAAFQAALKEGHVNSITVHAKCAHGFCYYPTKVGVRHPNLAPDFDLTGAEIDAAHEIGADAHVYICAGWDARNAALHPEWVMRKKDGSPDTINLDPNADPDAPRPDVSFYNLCLSGEYEQHFYRHAKEIVDRYPRLEGVFFDIIYMAPACYCPNCIKGMRAEGLDPENDGDAREYYRRSHNRFMENCRRIVFEKHPDAAVFFNSGGADPYRPEYHAGQTHFEMEHVPAVWGGYDILPARAIYFSRYQKENLGMIVRFHSSWGNFGGYKNPDALKYEVLLLAMFGSKCTVGDQMYPNGLLDPEAYRIIGHAYRALEKIEPWAFPASSTATLGVYLSHDKNSDLGLFCMLFENHIDFEIVEPGDDLGKYRCLILPDSVSLSREETGRINTFVKNGGAVLFTGKSAVDHGKFGIDCGAEYVGEGKFRQDYFCPDDGIRLPFGNAPVFCSQSAERINVTDGKTLAAVYEPWFDRTYRTYTSLQNTPQKDEPSGVAAVQKGNVVYLAHPLCRMYKTDGVQLYREFFMQALSRIYEPTYRVGLPSVGRTRLARQAEQNRYVFHAAYVSPISRGSYSVIEDVVPVNNVPVDIALPEAAKSVRLVPSMEEIPFEQKNGRLRFTIPCVNLMQTVEIRH